MIGEIKRDTAVFGPQQWYVEGAESGCVTIMFSTKEDAVNAARLAGLERRASVEDVTDRIRDFMDGL